MPHFGYSNDLFNCDLDLADIAIPAKDDAIASIQ
ncbi:hypothetical protein AMTRI_Chr08g205510 [Amborella trichopoda]